ncbi:hypothetical protein F0562_020948 [Nyssa sinensis]|uniref:Uncharacterized protein n=1 Tax=Nyssa sinensis TaxID=561372 RepID=A0A5J5BTK7_9ASTE|nr:hypothetical protein F0562_020948 [Nyssa sinensis]
MINLGKLIKMARKWQNLAAVRRKRLSFPRFNRDVNVDSCSTSMVADKGHFIVYTNDQRRFVIPLVYLNNEIFRELLKMSEEEFGLASDGPITVPCDAFFMEYIVSLIRRGVAKDLEKALLMSVATNRFSSLSSFHQGQTNQQLLVCTHMLHDGHILQSLAAAIVILSCLIGLLSPNHLADILSSVTHLDAVDFRTEPTMTTTQRELLKMSEEEFGLASDGPITVPCDAFFMEYIVSMIRKGVAKDLEKALLMSVATNRCSSLSSFHQGQTNQRLLVY